MHFYFIFSKCFWKKPQQILIIISSSYLHVCAFLGFCCGYAAEFSCECSHFIKWSIWLKDMIFFLFILCLLQIERYKAEIKKLQESEAEIKALSVNYAALLKEKEVFQ
jgi:hypothetical protein